jgi:hypothetical protein
VKRRVDGGQRAKPRLRRVSVLLTPSEIEVMRPAGPGPRQGCAEVARGAAERAQTRQGKRADTPEE